MPQKPSNFGMMIPLNAMSIVDEKPDPNGVPIYDKCPANGGLCACIGKCRQIIGYDTNPEKIAEYHKQVAARNEAMKEYRKSLFNGTWERGTGGDITYITNRYKPDGTE